jgi:two-component system OmpR family response regulator
MPGTFAGMRIAIIEDDALLRSSLALFLRARGGRVETYACAEEAGNGVIQGGFDLVISNYLLPGENGLSFLRKIRESTEKTGTVLTAAYAGRNVQKEALAGIDSFLVKPFSTKELEEALWRIIAGKGSGSNGILEVT